MMKTKFQKASLYGGDSVEGRPAGGAVWSGGMAICFQIIKAALCSLLYQLASPGLLFLVLVSNHLLAAD